MTRCATGEQHETKARRVKVGVHKVDLEGTTRWDVKSMNGTRGRRPESFSASDKQENQKRSYGYKEG